VATGLGGVVSQVCRADGELPQLIGAVGIASKQVDARDVPRLGLDLDRATGHVDQWDGSFGCSDASSERWGSLLLLHRTCMISSSTGPC
jgi:hypothetical protein